MVSLRDDVKTATHNAAVKGRVHWEGPSSKFGQFYPLYIASVNSGT